MSGSGNERVARDVVRSKIFDLLKEAHIPKATVLRNIPRKALEGQYIALGATEHLSFDVPDGRVGAQVFDEGYQVQVVCQVNLGGVADHSETETLVCDFASAVVKMLSAHTDLDGDIPGVNYAVPSSVDGPFSYWSETAAHSAIEIIVDVEARIDPN